MIKLAVEQEMGDNYVKKADGAIEALDLADTHSNLLTESELNKSVLSGGSALDI
jgi:hypothetical protein